MKKAAKKKSKPSVGQKIKILSSAQFNELKKILTDKRDDLLQMVIRKKGRDLPDVEIGDEIDNAVHTVEKEILFELTNNEKMMLDTIEAAIRKSETNKFGLCEHCNKKIGFARLKAMPWARYCIKCQTGADS
jgi:DnaK suppressor protein